MLTLKKGEEMARNNIVELTGNIGKEPTTHNPKTDEEFVVLRLVTTDSYQDDKGNWIEKDPVWHSVLFFAPSARDYARAYKTGDRVKVTGSLSYRTLEVTNQKGKVQKFTTASIIGSRIQDARLPRKVAVANQ